MAEIVLTASHRNVIGKQVKALRREGKLPAVVYGHGMQPEPITLDLREASHVLPYVTSSQLVVVEVNGVRHMSLVREKQKNPVTGVYLHVDFHEVSMTEKLLANVVLDFIGESPAVKNVNGVLVIGEEELEVECLPQYLPEKIVVDLSQLDAIGSTIRVRDIHLSSEIEVLSDPDEIIVIITPPVVDKELEAVEVVTEEPEVIERGKKEEEGL